MNQHQESASGQGLKRIGHLPKVLSKEGGNAILRDFPSTKRNSKSEDTDSKQRMIWEYYRYEKPKINLYEEAKLVLPYPEQSLESDLNQARRKVGLSEKPMVNCLPLTYTTHLLDRGTDLRFTKELLGGIEAEKQLSR